MNRIVFGKEKSALSAFGLSMKNKSDFRRPRPCPHSASPINQLPANGLWAAKSGRSQLSYNALVST